MFVYFMATDSYTKIGITNSLKSRIKQVQTGCPIMIFKVNYIEVENREKALEIEKHFHKKLNHLNTYGEWFYTTNQPFYNNILQILELFNYSENDINTYFDYSESKKNDFIGILNLKKEIKKNKPSKIKNLKKIKKQVDNIYLKYGL